MSLFVLRRSGDDKINGRGTKKMDAAFEAYRERRKIEISESEKGKRVFPLSPSGSTSSVYGNLVAAQSLIEQAWLDAFAIAGSRKLSKKRFEADFRHLVKLEEASRLICRRLIKDKRPLRDNSMAEVNEQIRETLSKIVSAMERPRTRKK